MTPPPAATTKPEGKVEEVYITGSRVKRVDLTTPAPVTVMTRADIDASGLQSVGDILQRLPFQTSAINTQTNNGGDGTTAVNLRGLGPQRTLVLVNGRRFVPGGSGAGSVVDVSVIPVIMVDHIEILKDGASALYGSEAIGGVVNIITRKNFTGVEGQAFLGGTRAGGTTYTLGVVGGERDEKGGFMLAFQLFDQEQMLAGQRDFSKDPLSYSFDCANEMGSDAPFNFGTGKADPMLHATLDHPGHCQVVRDSNGKPIGLTPIVTTNGSTGIPDGYYTGRTPPGSSLWTNLRTRYRNAATYITDPGDGFRPVNLAGNKDVRQGDRYNFQPENYLLTPNQRISFWGQGDYALHPRATAYVEASLTNRRSTQLLAPEPFLTLNEGIAVSRDNIYNPFGRDFPDVRRRMVEFGNRIFDQNNYNFRTVLGLNGTYVDSGWLSTWSWDANFIYGRSEAADVNRGNIVRHGLGDAIGPSFFDETGVPRCGTPGPMGKVIDGCVPINLFGGPGSITPGMINPLTYTGVAHGVNDQRVVNVSTDGELFNLRNRPVTLAFGYQFRREEGAFTPNPLVASGDSTGNKTNPTEGGYSEHAGFAEINVPLLSDIPAVDLFEVNAGVRTFKFTTFNADTKFKVGGRWQVMKHLALRGTYSQAFRAPSILELYRGQSDNFPNVSDPCSSRAPNGTPRTLTKNQQANCANPPGAPGQGVPVDYVDDRTQLLERIGGNANLKPETANIGTAGVVITPKGHPMLDGLSLTVDFWIFDISDTINNYGADVLLASCYENGDPNACSLIRRDAAHNIDRLIDLNTNVGGYKMNGFDFGLLYRIPTRSFGDFRLTFDGVLLNKFTIAAPGRSFDINAKGYFDAAQALNGGGNGGVFPPFRFNTGLAYLFQGAVLGLNLRYIGGIRECNGNDCRVSEGGVEVPDPNDPTKTVRHPALSRSVDSNVNVDVYLTYTFKSPVGTTMVQAGINNIFDQDPPFISNGFLASTDAYTYSIIGRFFYANLRQTF